MRLELNHNGSKKILKPINRVDSYETQEEVDDAFTFYIPQITQLIDQSEWEIHVDRYNDGVEIYKQPKNTINRTPQLFASIIVV